MSAVPHWLTDSSATQNNNGGPFNNPIDPASGMFDPGMGGYLQNSNPLDYQPFPHNQSIQSRMQNGNARPPSTTFHNPVYQVPSVVPSKRPRPREDSLGTSPRQAPGALPGSRSQTPQQVPYPGYQGGQHGPSPFPQPNAYQHLQQSGSANASPSPVMQNQQYRAPGPPQRVQTASPSPFPPNPQAFGNQLSPSPSEASRVNTPHGNPPTSFPQGMPYIQAYGQPFAPPPGMSGPPQTPMHAQQFQHPQNLQQAQAQAQAAANAQKMYHIRLQQQYQHNMIQRPPNSAQGQMQVHPGPSSNTPNVTGIRPQQPMRTVNNPEQFNKSVAFFMRQRGLPVATSVTIADRSFPMMQIYAVVTKYGGSKKVSLNGAWPAVAAALQLHQVQYPSAPQELKDYYERNLGLWEEYMQVQQRQKAMQNIQNMQPGGPGGVNPQMSPTKTMNVPGQNQSSQSMNQQQQQPVQSHQTPLKQNATSAQSRPQPPNGYLTPQQSQVRNRQQNQFDAQRPSSARKLDGTPPQESQAAAFPSPASAATGQQRRSALTKSPDTRQKADASAAAAIPQYPPQIQANFTPRCRSLDTHGGVNVEVMATLGHEMYSYKPDLPSLPELGEMEVACLTRCLQSGIHAEVRYALDFLGQVSDADGFQLHLRSCDDLLETLVDCAMEQVTLLALHATNVSDTIAIPSYEDIYRKCQLEHYSLQDVHPFATPEYEVDHAVSRLIAITIVIRNLSFLESNHALLAGPVVVKFMCTLIRYLGTRYLLLRTVSNTLDVMKDVITYLTNLSQEIELPGKEEASCLLQFLLAFSPCPPPTTFSSGRVLFTPYEKNKQPYLPSAVDSLAKLLARDEPNRSYYKAIFTADNLSTPSGDLMTRAFALAISPLPNNAIAKDQLFAVLEVRKPYLIQGMLAAEILVNLCPGPDHGLALSWLSSEDRFAANLHMLISQITTDQPQSRIRYAGNRRVAEPDMQAFLPFTLRATAVLRILSEKALKPDDYHSEVPADVLPSKLKLLSMHLNRRAEGGVIGRFSAFAGY
ncbi:MAG: hypothetical protein M1833_005044 [Piccolia ochrophora]|nr:MAG: hypothetical protein M1833_005044 [Piccolia ochrophora]